MIKATKITILWSEASRDENIQFTGEDVFGQANYYLKRLAHTLPEKHLGYYKTKFKIDYEDGETYEGRYDLKRHDIIYGDIGRHIRNFCKFYAGKAKPTHITPEQYKLFLQQTGETIVKEFGRFLDTYQIG